MASDDDDLEVERRYVGEVRDLAYHAMVYGFVNAILVVIDRRGGEGADPFLGLDWAYWVILGWGIGLAGHAVSVFFGEYRVQALGRRHRD